VLLRGRISIWLLVTLCAVSVLALVYTTPWDNLIIENGVWTYGHNRVAGILIDHVPLEECIFYVLQVILAGLAVAALLRRSS
jgi:lycopene beta-cyclase